jgi:acetyl esterase/lipase
VALFVASARPGALVFRGLLEHSPWATGRSVARSSAGGPSISDLQYDPGDPDARLDVYVPRSLAAGERLPAVIWIHGGAWISGTKDAAAPYFDVLARRGVTVIAIEYSRAPDARYPTPILQVNTAISYVLRNAERLHVDGQQVIIAGDSAGAQMASQVATLVTNPAYAADIGIDPSLRPDQLRGVILFCGAYDAASVARDPRAIPNTAFRLFSRSVLWAYTGSRTRDSDALRQMSTIDHVTSNFPPTFVSGGNADPLTDAHSRPFAARLAELGVDVTTLFYPPDRTPALGHEYQFRIESTDGQAALHSVFGFVLRRTERSR